MVHHMPLWRYFAFTGGALLALLLLANWYLPQTSAESTHAGVDKTVIRIQSSRQWPEAIVFDTNRPTVSPPVMTAEAAPLEATAAETPPAVERSPREAFAQLAPAPSTRPAASDTAPRKVAAKHQARARAPARRMAGYPVRRVASYQPAENRGFFSFGW
jgi:hypothetical protein